MKFRKLAIFFVSFSIPFIIGLSCSPSSPYPPLLGDYIPPIKDATLRDVKSSFEDSSFLDGQSCDGDALYEDASFDVTLDAISDSLAIKDSLDVTDVEDVDSSKEASVDNGILYHGGPIMVGTVNVYYIWYGDWSKNLAAKQILTDFMRNIGGSPYYDINTTYYSVDSRKSPSEARANMFDNEKPHHLKTIDSKVDYDEALMSKAPPVNYDGVKTYVSNSINYFTSCDDNYSFGKVLNEENIFSIVTNAIDHKALPLDYNGVYFVLTANDVTQDFNGYGFCSGFCGWHYYGLHKNMRLKYSFVGDPTQCPNSCASFTLKPNSNTEYLTPNDNLAADGMASVIAHELEEATSDPELNAWFDKYGWENADKCAWSFGYIYSASNGARANMKLGERDYLIQQNWVNDNGGYCGIKK